MFLVPFSMGPIGGPLSKNGIELTDSPYVAISMHVMARVGNDVLDCIRKDGTFIRYKDFLFSLNISRDFLARCEV